MGLEVLWVEAVGTKWTEAFDGSVNFVPEIVARERDVGPWQRCDLGQALRRG